MTSPAADLRGIFTMDALDGNVGEYVFLAEHGRRGHAHLSLRELGRAVPLAVLPDDLRVTFSVDGGRQTDTVGECGDVVVLLRRWRANAEVWTSAADPAAAATVADGIVARAVREVPDRRVEARFTDAKGGSRSVELDIRPWPEIASLYPAAVRSALDALVAHRPDPDEARRLLVWYGAPGTGKTSAVRALLHAWREWALGVVVTDPEQLLSDGRYLRRVVLDVDEDDDRWRLLVLEDAESLLRKGQRSTVALGRLLNLADGLLGQGLRAMFLVTTNEPVGELHPAVVRPGRCLARVEFGPLSAAETARLLGRPVDRGGTLAEVLAARPSTADVAMPAVGQYL